MQSDTILFIFVAILFFAIFALIIVYGEPKRQQLYTGPTLVRPPTTSTGKLLAGVGALAAAGSVIADLNGPSRGYRARGEPNMIFERQPMELSAEEYEQLPQFPEKIGSSEEGERDTGEDERKTDAERKLDANNAGETVGEHRQENLDNIDASNSEPVQLGSF